MKRLILIELLIVLAFAPAHFAYAQEATAVAPGTVVNVEPSAPPVLPSAIDLSAAAPYLVLIGILLLALVAVIIDNHIMAQKLADALSPATFEIVRAGLEKAIDQLGNVVRVTPTTLDDDVFALFKGKLDDLITDVAAREAAKTPPQVVVNNQTMPDSGSNSG